ncbi:MAG TPA: zf-HC2 domain-containing protein [Actinomycetota bacterium]|nr:zf-HC2 domain-containing protein [Actinomycetota bacterium]
MKEDCRITLQKAYLFLDGEVLSETERLQIQGHLEDCRPCLERYGLEGEVTTLVTRLTVEPCPESVKKRIQLMIQEQ